MIQHRKFASWTIGIIIIGTGLWCLSLAMKSALFAVSTGGLDGMPVDVRIMAFISSGITMIFSCLFLFSGGASIFRGNERQINYSPTLSNVAMLIIFVILSVLALSEYRATSKISWEESRGLPFSFLTLTAIRGICNAGIVLWNCRSFENLNPLVLIVDILIVYSAICAGVQALFELQFSHPKRWLLKSDEIKQSGG